MDSFCLQINALEFKGSRNVLHSASPHIAPSRYFLQRTAKTMKTPSPTHILQDFTHPLGVGNLLEGNRILLSVLREVCHLLTPCGLWPCVTCRWPPWWPCVFEDRSCPAIPPTPTYSQAQRFLWTKMTDTLTISSSLGLRRRTARRISGPGNQGTRGMIRGITQEPFSGVFTYSIWGHVGPFPLWVFDWVLFWAQLKAEIRIQRSFIHSHSLSTRLQVSSFL